jgi:hypothetical protein
MLNLFLMGIAARAQSIIHRSDQQWTQYQSQLTLSSRISFNTDVSIRCRSKWSELSALTFRTGLVWQVPKSWQLGVAAASFITFQNHTLQRAEWRLHQEAQHTYSGSKLRFRNRLRIEQRTFQFIQQNKWQDPVLVFRFRYRILLEWCFWKKNLSSLSGLAGNELFVNAGRSVRYNQFDNNRFITGLLIDWNKGWSSSCTYVYQLGHRNAPEEWDYTDILWLSVIHRINISSKNKG